MSNPEPLLTCRQAKSGTETTAISGAVGAGPGGCPDYWLGGVRHGGGMSLVCGSCRKRGKARPDTVRRKYVRCEWVSSAIGSSWAIGLV
jgi:hypothetical protein